MGEQALNAFVAGFDVDLGALGDDEMIKEMSKDPNMKNEFVEIISQEDEFAYSALLGNYHNTRIEKGEFNNLGGDKVAEILA